jgi:hypothetical protein
MLYYGQDLDAIDRLPTDLVFAALEPEALAARLRPWLARSRVWSVAEEADLVAPRMEPVGGGVGYVAKRGSRGLLLQRRSGR